MKSIIISLIIIFFVLWCIIPNKLLTSHVNTITITNIVSITNEVEVKPVRYFYNTDTNDYPPIGETNMDKLFPRVWWLSKELQDDLENLSENEKSNLFNYIHPRLHELPIITTTEEISVYNHNICDMKFYDHMLSENEISNDYVAWKKEMGRRSD